MDYLKYGLINHNLVHINDVASGLDCNCVCPHCKSLLIARKGQKRAYHFAHYMLADCNHGTETALHIMAKNIVEETRRVFVPYVPKNVCDNSSGGKIVLFENAELEKQLSETVRGDVVLYNGDRLLNVEIKVTHEVGLEKTIELFNLGIATIEIDFSDIKSNFTPATIKQRLLSGEHTKLIFSPKNKEFFARLILGEWKTLHRNSYGRYVIDCPISGERAYVCDIQHRGGKAECHGCYAFADSLNHSGDKFLCMGIIDGLDVTKIEKIMSLKKEKNHIRYVKLMMSDGSVVEKVSKL